MGGFDFYLFLDSESDFFFDSDEDLFDFVDDDIDFVCYFIERFFVNSVFFFMNNICFVKFSFVS